MPQSASTKIPPLRCYAVAMMQATKSSEGLNPASVVRACSGGASFWRVLGQPQMGSVFVVVADVFAHESLQMPFTEHDHMIEQVTAAAPHPALRDSVLPRTAKRPAVKAGWLNGTLTNHRNADALDGVLGTARNKLMCPRCVPGEHRAGALSLDIRPFNRAKRPRYPWSATSRSQSVCHLGGFGRGQVGGLAPTGIDFLWIAPKLTGSAAERPRETPSCVSGQVTVTCIARVRSTRHTGMVGQANPFAENHSTRNGSAS